MEWLHVFNLEFGCLTAEKIWKYEMELDDIFNSGKFFNIINLMIGGACVDNKKDVLHCFVDRKSCTEAFGAMCFSSFDFSSD